MLVWLLLGLALYFVQLMMPAIAMYFKLGLRDYMGSRDNEPVLTGVAGRLARAANNMRENFPMFATLALAALVLGMGESGAALLGAQIFVIARMIYVPLYAFAVPVARSLAAMAGWVGLIIMVLALLGSVA